MKIFVGLIYIISYSFCLGSKPNIILIMADDQGWGQTGYYKHPILKTPNLDKMAANGLRFDRFYAGGPVCSPTRASVLTGRTHDRTGVFDHGYALRKQERTLPQALKEAGYKTGHFGKWHLNGLRGPGVPILDKDPNGPGNFGFDTWLSVTNFFDINPIMSRNGKFKKFKGDSSEIIVKEALKFISKAINSEKAFFSVIWFGTPHSPWMGLEKDLKEFKGLDNNSQAHYAELRAMDRSIGHLRSELRKLGIEKDTLLWFTSDNGGLPKIKPNTTGNLRDYKGSLYEGGIRVPAIIEWPRKIIDSQVSSYPAGAVDIFPTISDICKLPVSSHHHPQDGTSLTPLFEKNIKLRNSPLIFSSRGRMAIIDNDWKLISLPTEKEREIKLFNISKDPQETTNLFRPSHPQVNRLRKILIKSRNSIAESVNGLDYKEGVVLPQPPRIFWPELPEYQKFFTAWRDRPEYKSLLLKFNKI